MKGQDGFALLMTIVALPVLVSLLLLVVAGGSLYASRCSLQSAVDMAALAGAQELDWDALAEGKIRLVSAQAEEQALALLWINLASVPRADISRADITVRAINSSPQEPVLHPGSGRILQYPTVWVMVRVPVRPVGPPDGLEAWLWATADASVEPRR